MADRPDISATARRTEIDTTVAHVARVYDYMLGGIDNFAVDRAAAEQVTAATGGVERSRLRIQANRRFLGRAVRYLAGEAGIRQFLDLGTGIPAADNVHQVAHQVAPDSRIVYVDDDPVVLAHAHALLEGLPPGAAGFIPADLRDTGHVLGRAAATLDFSRPVAVMLVSVLHLFPDAAELRDIVSRYVERAAPGSYLVISHLADESRDMTTVARAIKDNPAVSYTLTPRSHAEILRFFGGLVLVDPGLVFVDRWRPDGTERPPDTGDHPFYAGVARV